MSTLRSSYRGQGDLEAFQITSRAVFTLIQRRQTLNQRKNSVIRQLGLRYTQPTISTLIQRLWTTNQLKNG